MAHLVERALEDGRHALIEAGTGSGKSFAYLIPLIWTGRRAFVSTANKTLQNQLWEKDLPALQRIAPHSFKAALLKGRSNYVCRVRLKEWHQQLQLPGQGLSVGEVMKRLEQTPSGDVEELRLFGELRDRLTVGHHECLGQRCPQLGRCYYELARMRAEKADVVVLNHALLAFNLVLDHQIVEPRDAIVIDEAHDFVPYVISEAASSAPCGCAWPTTRSRPSSTKAPSPETRHGSKLQGVRLTLLGAPERSRGGAGSRG